MIVFKPATGRPYVRAFSLSGTVPAFTCDCLRFVCAFTPRPKVDLCLRFREQCLRSEITSVSRVALVLLLRFVAGNMGVNTPASKRSQLIGNTGIVRKRCVIHTNSTCVCWRLSVATFTQKRKDASFDLWPPLRRHISFCNALTGYFTRIHNECKLLSQSHKQIANFASL